MTRNPNADQRAADNMNEPVIHPITITWRFCTNELPEPHHVVLVALSDSDELVWTGYHDGKYWRDLNDLKFNGEVTSWAELPEPPRP